MKHIRFDEEPEALNELYRIGMPPGASTGWIGVDKLLTIGPGRVTVITGVPNHGKSAWTDALMVNLLDRPLSGKTWKFMICSPENEPMAYHRATILEKYVGKRFAAGKTRMTKDEIAHYSRELSGRIEFVKLEEREQFGDLLADVAQWCGERSSKWQPGVILDPWNTLEHNRPRNMPETDYIGECLSAAQRIVKRTGAHLFIVAHPQKPEVNAKSQGRVVTPYDISGSAHWFNKPDNCITVHRYPNADSNDENYMRTEVYVQKVRWRHEGRQGMARLLFEPDSGRYTCPETGKQPPRELPENAEVAL